jgi:NAD(P)-dependent dehydrogenase (short-subunit alcohol dehydrogenase family)
VADSTLSGRTFLITGANTGIGRVTAEVLAKRGGKLFLAGRSEEKTKPVLDGIRASGGAAEFLRLDLGDLAQVRSAAKTFLDRGEPLHVLINNAGLAQRGLTKDGFELTWGTNHLGPFLFTNLLLPRLRESTPARIVNVASTAHYRTKEIPWDTLRQPTRTRTAFDEYSMSKLCNVLFTLELARGRAGKGVTSYAVHPGTIATDIWRHLPFFLRPILRLFMKTAAEGAETSLYCASSESVKDDDGLFYNDCQVRRPSKIARDPDLARELWERSEAWAGLS